MITIKKRYTNWLPFGNYSFAETDYIVFVRKNKRNGMMQFKTKKVHSWLNFHCTFVPKLIDVKQAWEEILKMK